VTSYTELLACRFLAGLGLGGAIPCIIALTSEYVSTRRRSIAVATLWAGFPLGGMLGGFSSAWLIPRFGWQAVFVVGGVLPLLAAIALTLWLPESLRFLVARQGDQPRAARIMRRLAPDLSNANRYIVEEESISGAPIAALFRDGRAATTLLLWVPFFIVFMMLAHKVSVSFVRLHQMRFDFFERIPVHSGHLSSSGVASPCRPIRPDGPVGSFTSF